MTLGELSLNEVAKLIQAKKVSPVEVTEAVLMRLEDLEPTLNAFITPTPERARHAAKQAEKEISAGSYRGPLHGVPISLKDLYWTKGVRTTGGSKILADFVPVEDAATTALLEQAGAVLVGKTNLHEFAFGTTTENPHFGPSRNPWDPDRIVGGSSGGSGAEVAAGISYGSLGTDTGGSIRIPASMCGIVGLKPTFGRVSRYGVIPLSWSLDHVGPMTRTVADAAVMLQAIAGFDPRDVGSANVPNVLDLSALESGVGGLRIGVPKEYFFEGVDPDVEQAVRAAIEQLAELGAICEEVSVPSVRHSRPSLFLILSAEAANYHLKSLQERPGDFGRDVRDRLDQGAASLAIDYVQAQRVRAMIQAEVDQILDRFDLIATPTTPIAAVPIGQTEQKINDTIGDARNALARFTSAFNLTGSPAISIPCGFTREQLPIGLQLAGRPFDEVTVLRAAAAYEQATDWRRLPSLATGSSH